MFTERPETGLPIQAESIHRWSGICTMEEDGIITRTVYPEVPPHVEYALSETGESMRPILNAMQEWGTNYKESFQ